MLNILCKDGEFAIGFNGDQTVEDMADYFKYVNSGNLAKDMVLYLEKYAPHKVNEIKNLVLANNVADTILSKKNKPKIESVVSPIVIIRGGGYAGS